MVSKAEDIKTLMRTHQWFKNILIFAVPFFAGQLFHPNILLKSILAFISFSLAASATYVFNDLADIEADRLHPQKKLRPLVQGRISEKESKKLMGILIILSFVFALPLPTDFLKILLLYLAISSIYSMGLKRVFLLDVFLVSIGYLLRVLAGQGATGIPASSWLLITVFLMALLISLGKRRVELSTLGTEASNHRISLTSYSLDFIDQAILITSSSSLITYILYTVERGRGLVFTTIPAIYGILRYLQLLRKGKGGDPIKTFFKDPHLLISGFILLGAIFIRVYL